MAKFTTDWLRTKETIESKNGHKLVALWRFNYPIYCIHSIILDSSPSPFEKLDKQIYNLALANSSNHEMSTLLGLNINVIKSRFDDLVNNNLLVINGNTIQSTELGIDVFVLGKQEIQRKKRYDFYLDGVRLEPLTRQFYTTKFLKHSTTEHDDRFHPDIEFSPPSKDVITEAITKISDSQKQDFEIPSGFMEIKEFSYTKMSYPLLATIEWNDLTGYNYQILDGFKSVSIIDDDIDFKLFSSILTPYFNKGLRIQALVNQSSAEQLKKDIILDTTWKEIDRHKSALTHFIGPKVDFVTLLQNSYDTSFLDSDVNIDDNVLSVSINTSNFRTSSMKVKLLNALDRSFDLYYVRRSCVQILVVNFLTNDNYIAELIKLNNLLIKVTSKDEIMEFVTSSAYDEHNLLLDLGRYQILEELSISNHFRFLKNEI